jgi:hypothetical protein
MMMEIFISNGYNPKFESKSKTITTKAGAIKHYSRLRIYSTSLCNELISVGIPQRKSLILEFPHITSEYMPDYIRGFFDGDGNCFVKNKKQSTGISFNSASYSFLDSLNKYLSNLLPVTTKTIREQKKKYNSIYRVDYCSNESNTIREYMYSTSSKLYLIRKKDDKYTYIPRVRKNLWTQEEIQYLVKNYNPLDSVQSKADIANVLGKTEKSTHMKAFKLGILPKRQ